MSHQIVKKTENNDQRQEELRYSTGGYSALECWKVARS